MQILQSQPGNQVAVVQLGDMGVVTRLSVLESGGQHVEVAIVAPASGQQFEQAAVAVAVEPAVAPPTAPE